MTFGGGVLEVALRNECLFNLRMINSMAYQIQRK